MWYGNISINFVLKKQPHVKVAHVSHLETDNLPHPSTLRLRLAPPPDATPLQAPTARGTQHQISCFFHWEPRMQKSLGKPKDLTIIVEGNQSMNRSPCAL